MIRSDCLKKGFHTDLVDDLLDADGLEQGLQIERIGFRIASMRCTSGQAFLQLLNLLGR
jgi:hypothetical protein